MVSAVLSQATGWKQSLLHVLLGMGWMQSSTLGAIPPQAMGWLQKNHCVLHGMDADAQCNGMDAPWWVQTCHKQWDGCKLIACSGVCK